jgi:twitching motility protein PilI
MTSTDSGSDDNLRSLRDRPFELLKELEKRSRRCRRQRAGPRTPARMGGRGVSDGRRDLPGRARGDPRGAGLSGRVTRIPGAKSWVKGLANVRGQLLPMLDLRQFLGSGATTPGRNTRVVVVNHRDIPAGLIVDEVLGFRRFAERNSMPKPPPTVIRCDSYLAGAFRRGGEVWPVLEFEELVESQSFLQAATS